MAVSNFQGALRTFLLADSALSALIGARVYSPEAPQGATLPYMVFQLISEVDFGNIAAADGVVQERWQFDVYAATIDAALTIKEALYTALHYKYSVTWSGYKIYLAMRAAGGDVFGEEPNADGSEAAYKRITQDYSIKRNHAAT